MKYLVVGLGNIGSEYEHTRHNIGFEVVDFLAKEADAVFESDRYASVATIRHRGNSLVLIKPSTYMNLSGKAVRYWMEKEKTEISRVLVVVDDLALDVGALRMKGAGSDGGHNGLANIAELLGSTAYPRLRFGIGKNFSRGGQVDYVLNRFSAEEMDVLKERIPIAAEMCKSFAAIGLERTMNLYNKK